MNVLWECKVCHQHFATIEELCDHCHVEGEHDQCPAVPAQEACPQKIFADRAECRWCNKGPLRWWNERWHHVSEQDQKECPTPLPFEDQLPAVPAPNHCPGCDEYGASHTTPSIEHPAVPAQPNEEPRSASPFYGNSECAKCKTHLYGKRTYSIPSGIPPARMIVCSACAYPAEPQAGAQVPSQEPNKEPFFPREGDAEGLLLACHKLYDKLQEEKAHLNTIRNYVIEAAKTPITREDMHDPMKAQAFFDETEGFYRLVKSEIGGQNAK
jgi:hypothetical protein